VAAVVVERAPEAVVGERAPEAVVVERAPEAVVEAEPVMEDLAAALVAAAAAGEVPEVVEEQGEVPEVVEEQGEGPEANRANGSLRRPCSRVACWEASRAFRAAQERCPAGPGTPLRKMTFVR